MENIDSENRKGDKGWIIFSTSSLVSKMLSYKKASSMSWLSVYGGGGRIRTIEGGAGRFTVCSLWPLG
ncbi:hypothetical protein, partial [Vibrio cholerae]|uniref:hypothetical protein n=1 Tax=Vibrio cholerae TaxID=666 RepID=UPI001F1D5160